MNNIFLSAMLIAGMACGTQKTASNMPEETKSSNDGFVSLFDGKSMNGWHKFNGGAAGSAWQADNGVMHFLPKEMSGWQTVNGGDIVTDQEFENFHLKLEWKISANGNSGIMFMVNENPKYQYAWNTGPEMQVLDNDGHADGKINKHRAGDLYDLIACKEETVKPVGEWNLAEIIMNRGKLQLRLNGTTVVETSYGDDAWRNMLANSKFKSMPDFGTYSKGRIALQDHGNEVWYRNIMIKKL